MAAKAILVFCAQAFLIKTTFSQCFGREAYYSSGLIAPYSLLAPAKASNVGCTGFPSAIEITATSGGNLPVTSASPVPPTGVSIASENLYEGLLAVAGEVPFVGTVAVDGVLHTAGVGAVNYDCGSGATDIYAETIPTAAAFSPAGIVFPVAGVTPAAAFAPSAFAIPAVEAPASCGCGAFY